MLKNLDMIGDNLNKISINNIIVKKNELSATVHICSDWYEAKAEFITSILRLKKFKEDIDKIFVSNYGTATFINEESNFEITLTMSKTGKINAFGCLSKNLIDESKLDYYLEFDYHNLKNFNLNLGNQIN